ncbi:MAG: pseudouridine synthase [Chloroflexota bacterium]
MPSFSRRASRFRVYRYGNGPDAQKLKEATTEWRLLEKLADNKALIELRPKTGRTHQLRVHMTAIGYPLAGDALYQLSDEDYLAWCDTPEKFPNLGFHRHALHCWRYQFVHPITNESTTIEAPPDDFDATV